eukprot:2224080-Ditylum_brightwellii.AAC.1
MECVLLSMLFLSVTSSAPPPSFAALAEEHSIPTNQICTGKEIMEKEEELLCTTPDNHGGNNIQEDMYQ